MDDFAQEIPKAELHLHLEGSVEPETLHELDPSTPVSFTRPVYPYPFYPKYIGTGDPNDAKNFKPAQ